MMMDTLLVQQHLFQKNKLKGRLGRTFCQALLALRLSLRPFIRAR
jgi:hypothetical protein